MAIGSGILLLEERVWRLAGAAATGEVGSRLLRVKGEDDMVEKVDKKQ
jgi:hypothetical protein